MQILTIVLPVFFIILIGYISGKSKIIQSKHLDALNDFAYYVALPALIIFSFWQIDFKQSGLTEIIGYNFFALALFAFFLLLVLNATHLNGKTKAALFLSSLVGNTIYIGFPIGKQAFGQDNFSIVAGVGAIHLVLGTFLGVMATMHWTQKHENLKLYLKEFFQNPLILSLIGGIILSFVPNFGKTEIIFKNSLTLLAGTASPVALFALGCFLSQNKHKIPLSLKAVPIIIKLLIFPTFIFLLLNKFGQSQNPLNISSFLATMPTAVSTFVIAEKFELDEKLVADSLLTTTLLSVISISLILYFLK